MAENHAWLLLATSLLNTSLVAHLLQLREHVALAQDAALYAKDIAATPLPWVSPRH